MIKITTDNQISVLDFPEGTISEQNEKLRGLIGPGCRCVEHVAPKRLYTVLGAIRKRIDVPGETVGMLVDEEGYFQKLDVNLVGSYLYETDRHGNPILGNILIIGEMYEHCGISFCGINDEQFEILYPQLEELTEKAREHR